MVILVFTVLHVISLFLVFLSSSFVRKRKKFNTNRVKLDMLSPPSLFIKTYFLVIFSSTFYFELCLASLCYLRCLGVVLFFHHNFHNKRCFAFFSVLCSRIYVVFVVYPCRTARLKLIVFKFRVLYFLSRIR